RLDRLAAALSLMLLAALGLVTFQLAQRADRGEARPAAPARPGEPDYFVERLALSSMNAQGEPTYRLEARRLRHFPDDDTTEFDAPTMVSLDPSRPRITIVADSGRLLAGGEEAHLSGNVVVTRAATDRGAKMVAETEYAIVYPDRDLIVTDRPVTLVQEGSRLQGVGMELDNRTRQLRLDSRVRAVWQAPPAPADAPGRARTR
ncbi:MAG TPA: LPS export ABC transporter periplasmic protein LptC, partial [Burkholderiaceae bacterium]|nr:LPS export ABC transporter periplasmic protein LptC [Burkholderiaceae bacterium]